MFKLEPLGGAVKAHVGGGTPSRQVASFWDGGIPWASVKDFLAASPELFSTQETISYRGLNASASHMIPAGTPLVCTRMAVGRAAMAMVPLAINQDVKALFPAANFDASYLLRLMQYAQRLAIGQAIGSTVQGIRISNYLALDVPQAPTIEQPKIAEVLATIELVIKQTGAVIEKLKQAKQGLLHDLLTRGVDANGEIRPCYEDAPHLYQESALGWLPVEWTLSSVFEEFNIVTGLSLGPHRQYGMNRVPYLRVANVQRANLDLTDIAAMSATPAELANRIIEIDDLLIVEGHASTNEIGRCAIADARVKGFTFQNHLFKLRARRLDPVFALHWMNSSYVKSYWASEASTSSGLNTINRSKLEKVLVIAPPIAEQLLISSMIRAIEMDIQAETENLTKLSQTKVGLMDDLLTGRVRVTPLLALEGTSP